MALGPNKLILRSFWMISQATDMLKQKFQQFWNLESAHSDHSNDIHKPYIFDQKNFDLKRGILKTLKFCGNL